jgi:hypothetical protein
MTKPTLEALVAAGLDTGVANEVLATMRERAATEIKFYYMNDNHTFKPLEGNTLEAIVDAAKRHLRTTRYNYGMLCAPSLLNAEGRDVRRSGPFSAVHAHARGSDAAGLAYFDEQCELWLRAHGQDPDIVRLLGERVGESNG